VGQRPMGPQTKKLPGPWPSEGVKRLRRNRSSAECVFQKRRERGVALYTWAKVAGKKNVEGRTRDVSESDVGGAE